MGVMGKSEPAPGASACRYGTQLPAVLRGVPPPKLRTLVILMSCCTTMNHDHSQHCGMTVSLDDCGGGESLRLLRLFENVG